MYCLLHHQQARPTTCQTNMVLVCMHCTFSIYSPKTKSINRNILTACLENEILPKEWLSCPSQMPQPIVSKNRQIIQVREGLFNPHCKIHWMSTVYARAFNVKYLFKPQNILFKANYCRQYQKWWSLSNFPFISKSLSKVAPWPCQ